MKKIKNIAKVVLVVSGAIVSGALSAGTGFVIPIIVVSIAKVAGAVATTYFVVEKSLEDGKENSSSKQE